MNSNSTLRRQTKEELRLDIERRQKVRPEIDEQGRTEYERKIDELMSAPSEELDSVLDRINGKEEDQRKFEEQVKQSKERRAKAEADKGSKQAGQALDIGPTQSATGSEDKKKKNSRKKRSRAKQNQKPIRAR